MASLGNSNCEAIRSNFEGREAVYIEQGVLIVRVEDIRPQPDAKVIEAFVEEIPTPGLECSFFHLRRPNAPTPLRWRIVAGFLSEFSEHCWKMGYHGWSLYFAPEYLSALRSLARQWPPDLDPIDRYKEALRLEKIPYGEQIERVFPDEGESR